MEKMMEALKEFLECSTIHGVFYISTAKVSHILVALHTDHNNWGFGNMVNQSIVSEYSGKGILAHDSMPWFLRSWFSDQQIIF